MLRQTYSQSLYYRSLTQVSPSNFYLLHYRLASVNAPYGFNADGQPLVQIEWHTQIEAATRQMMEITAADTARRLSCPRVMIR